VLTPVDGVIIATAAYGIAYVFVMIVAYAGGVSTRGGASLFALLLFLIAYALVARLAGDPMRCVRLRRARPLVFICAVLASLAIIPTAVSLNALIITRIGIPDTAMKYLLEVLRAESVAELIHVWLVAALGAAIGEEFVFRGVFQNALSNRITGGVAVVVTAALFAALHTWRFPSAFVMGAFLGVLYLRTRTILVPFAAHLTINSVVVLMQYAIDNKGEGMLPRWLLEEKMAPVFLIAVSGLFFVLMMMLLYRLTRNEAAIPWLQEDLPGGGKR
jgi:membrane protease YdiL (CAAX protease family)